MEKGNKINEKRLQVTFENCHGIQKLDHTFTWRDKHLINIYAPNGVMKTSFAKTFQEIRDKKETCDEVFKERKTIRSVAWLQGDGEVQIKKEIEPEQVIVPCAVQDALRDTDRMKVLLANEELREQYVACHKEVDDVYGVLEKDLKRQYGTTKPIINLFCSDFGVPQNQFEETLLGLEDKVQNTSEEFASIKFSELFTSALDKVLKEADLKTSLQEYADAYDSLTERSTVFKKIFNPAVANKVSSELKKDGFFKAEHRVLLNKESEPLDEKTFENRLQEEKDRILIDPDLKKRYEKIDEILGATKDADQLRSLLDGHPELVRGLQDKDQLKKDIWLAYLHKNLVAYTSWRDTYVKAKQEIATLISKAKQSKTEWQKAVEIFNLRYKNMPFRLTVSNQSDVILKQDAAVLRFQYQDASSSETKEMERDFLQRVLSTGENRALALLDIIFMVEAAKTKKEDCIIILDDIADSFDYRNKYAIIEYLNEIQKDDHIFVISLTHNFDFYRTLGSRLELRPYSFLVERKRNECIFTESQYLKNVFSVWKGIVKNKGKNYQKIFVATLPFIRNLCEYRYSEGDPSYSLLTDLLHIKKKSKDILVRNVQPIYEKEWNVLLPEEWLDKQVIQMVYDEALAIINSEPSVLLENKIVLSIAIRLQAEEFMISRLEGKKYPPITKDQTRQLVQYCEDYKVLSQEELDVMQRVLLMTSENIHLNSFMFEPLIDIGIDELRDLFKDVQSCVKAANSPD